ncbi:MAG: hypothetical protein ACJ8F7_10865 [Gemmataceae bacterium]
MAELATLPILTYKLMPTIFAARVCSMFLLIHATSPRQQLLGVAADRCADCQAVRPFDITRYVRAAGGRSNFARKRCWVCGRISACDEHQYECFATPATVERWTLGTLLDRTHSELADELQEVGEPIEELQVSQLPRAPLPVVRQLSTWESLRALFVDIPWLLFWTLTVGIGVMFCGAFGAEGKLWFVTRALPCLYAGGVTVSLLLVLAKRWLREPASLGNEAAVRRAPSPRAWALALVVLIIGSMASLAAEAWRLGQGWPSNPNTDWIVVAPGARTKVHLSKKLRSVKGYWSATASATLLNLPPGVPAGLGVESSDKTWDGTIQLGEQEENADLWVVTRLPTNTPPGEAKLRVRLEPTYPVKRADGRYYNVKTEVTEEVELFVSPDRAATQEYYNVAWGGFAVSVLLAGGAALLLSYFDIRAALSRAG